MPTASTSELSGGAKAAAILLGIVVPIFATGLAAYIASQYANLQRELDGLTQRILVIEGIDSGLVSSVAKVLQHVELHSAEKNHWIQRIEENTRSLSTLAKDATARPDPYTGTKGREDKAEVMGRIDKLFDEVRMNERRLDALEQCCVAATGMSGMDGMHGMSGLRKQRKN